MRISDWSSDVCSSDLRAPEQRLVGQHLVHAVQEHDCEYLVGLSNQFKTQVVPHGSRSAEARSDFEGPSLQKRNSLLDDPVLMLGCEGGKRLHAGVLDNERHAHTRRWQSEGASTGRATPPGDRNKCTSS